MAVDVTSVFVVLLGRNRGPDPHNPDRRQRPDYGASAVLEGNTLDVVLTFRDGCAYCCFEWGCHLALTAGTRWDDLRLALAEHGVTAPERLELRLTCAVEEGAVFFDLFRPDPGRRGWYAFRPVAAHRYQASATERSARDA